MKESELYRRADEVLVPYLAPKGFAQVIRAGEYQRVTEKGKDRIVVSRGPPSKARSHFAVYMSYYPDYLNPLFEVFDYKNEGVGYPCGPYLNPVGASRRPKYWSYRDSEALTKSLEHVLYCLDQAGLAWLDSLRDPKVFAANVDPVAPIPSGLAHEAAGDFVRARQSYGEMMRRLRLVLQSKPSEAILLKKVARPFVLVAMKLGIEAGLCEHFKRKANYFPDIKAIPPGDDDDA
jgi:hypothetical protein